MATKVDTASNAQIKKTMNMTSLFQARLAETPKKRMPPSLENEQNLEEKEKIC